MIGYIILGVVSFLILVVIFLLIVAKIAHKKLFGNRYKSDSRISFYTKEEFGLKTKDVEIPLKDIKLKGSIFYYDNCKDDSLFIYCHGMWSGIPEYVQDIEFFCKNGYPVLAIEYEGTNNSEGKSIRGISNSLRCIDSVMKYVMNDEELKNKKIYVAGHSWGGFATSNIPYYYPNIKGIIAISPFIDIIDCFKGLMKKPLWFIIPFIKVIDFFACGKFALANSKKSLRNFKGNIVILHSKNDNIVNFMYNTNKLMNDKKINAKYMISSDKYHFPNYTMEAIHLFLEFQKTMQSLHTNEEKTEYMKTCNFHKMGEIDSLALKEALDYVTKEN